MPPGSKSPLSPIQKRLSRTGGFYQLDNNSRPNDVTVDIPLDPVRTPSSSSSGVRYASTSVASTISKEKGDDKLLDSFSGRRRIPTLDANGNASRVGYDGEEEYLNSIGKIYYKIIHFSIVTRYFIYVFPLAFFFAIPILVGVTVEPRTSIGGVPIIWLFVWVEVVWIGLWISKLFAHYLPLLFRTFAGIASSDVRKYALVIKALEIPLSLVGWAVTSFLTFIPLTSHVPAMLRHSSGKPQHWQTGLKRLLAAATVCSVLFLVQKAFIQGLGINYHRRQFNARVKDNKRKVQLMTLLYEASRTLFPVNCPEFREEDAIIENPTDTTAKKEGGAAAPQTPGTPATPGTPSNFLSNFKRARSRITSTFNSGNAPSAQSVVTSALENAESLDALARRIWMSFVAEGGTALYEQDIVDMLPHHEEEAREAFRALDQDGNGDISLEEMVLTITKISRTRKDISDSMRDVAQAIHVLDGLLTTVVLIACILVVVAFLNTSFVGTLATTGTALLSLSFIFSVTCQEVLGSCVFLFIKHPYDVGDRVEISGVRDFLTVTHISLLFTVFKQRNGRSIQFPNIVLNGLWIANFNRSVAMKEFIPVSVAYDTPFDDITTLKSELQAFLRANSRDFYPEVEIDIEGVADLNRLELTIESRHKRNYGNESLRVARRAKFMAALVCALRRVPLHPPGGTDATLGAVGQPSYTVSLTPAEAEERRSAYLAAKDAKRLVPAHAASARRDTTPTPTMAEENALSPSDYDSRSIRSPIAGRSNDNQYDGLSLRSPVARSAEDARDPACWWGKRKASHVSGVSPISPSVPEPARLGVWPMPPVRALPQPLPKLTIVPPASASLEAPVEYYGGGGGGGAAQGYGRPGTLSPLSPLQGWGSVRGGRGGGGSGFPLQGSSYHEQAAAQEGQRFGQQQPAMMAAAAGAALLSTAAAVDFSAAGGSLQEGERGE